MRRWRAVLVTAVLLIGLGLVVPWPVGAQNYLWSALNGVPSAPMVNIGPSGVRLTGDGDGAITFLGLGNGTDEDLTLNLDDSADTAAFTSSTGVTAITLTTAGGTINLSPTQMQIAAAGSFEWASRAVQRSSANGLWSVATANEGFGVQINTGTAAPTLGTCTAGVINADSRNTAGGYTANTSGSCIVTFGAPAWTNAPTCVAMSIASTTHPRISAISTTSMTVTGGVSGEAINYICLGRL